MVYEGLMHGECPIHCRMMQGLTWCAFSHELAPRLLGVESETQSHICHVFT